jgi:NADPH:quinone reductase-like Zn-dependent oxidoreductase
MAPKGRLFTLLALVGEGRLRPVVHAVVPMAGVADAHRMLEGRDVFGKVVLSISR